jgi:hypothetical protein
MAATRKEPTLQDLLSRIVMLEAENTRLRVRLDDVQEGLSIFMAATADEFAHVNELLWPLVDKIFPKLREMKSKMDAVVPPCFADPRADRQKDSGQYTRTSAGHFKKTD